MPLTPEQVTALRVVLPDDEPIFGIDKNEYLFTEEELNAIYDHLAGQNLKRTAGYACRALGNTDLLVLKYVRIDERTTDGARTAVEWRQAARQFFDEADREDSLEEGEEFFDLIDDIQAWRNPELAAWPWGPPW